jgi:transketolase
MRTAFINTIEGIAEKDDRVNLLVGDLGFGVVQRFAERFPDRFVNMGVAEQNMAGVAAGMAMCGKVVFTYSISNFPTMRCMEQIRNDICYHNADVKIVCVGGGVAYGSVGATHFATEDIAMMRALPNMTIVAPCDAFETEQATIAIVQRPGPCYLRLGRVGEPAIHQPGVPFEVGKAITVREGGDVTLISAGSILNNTLAIAEQLSARGTEARVVSMHTIKPLDVDAVMAAARDTSAIISIEEHSVVGGLGSAIVETLADNGSLDVPVKRIGLPPKFASDVGSQEYLWNLYGLSVEGISQTVDEFLNR